jgi:protein SCO1/2
MNRAGVVGLVAATLLFAAPASGADHAAGDQQPVTPSPIGGSFVLRDQYGRVVYDQDLRGRFMLVYFGYTFCPDVCPTSLQTLSVVLDQLGPQADKLWPLFITVDPQRDTAKVLRDYVQAFNPNILGLSGPEPYVESVIAKYHIKVEKVPSPGVPGGYTLDHTSSLILMDPYGAYVTRYPHGTPPEDIVADLRERLKVAR